MEGIIRIKLSELNAGFVEHIKTLFEGKGDMDLTLSFDDRQHTYYEALSRSKKDLENGNNLTTFTMDELEVYSKTNVG
jgi:hypothetical protein